MMGTTTITRYATNFYKKLHSNSKPEIFAAVVAALIVGGLFGFVIGNNRIQKYGPMEAATITSTSDNADGVTIGGSKLPPTESVIQNAASAPNLTNAVAAYKAAGLVDTLSMAGPYTIFIPTNDAFATSIGIEAFLKTENRAVLTQTLNSTIVPGVYTAAELEILAGSNQTLTTLDGQKITCSLENNTIKLTNTAGASDIETADAISSNGVIHAVSGLLVPSALTSKR